MDEIHPATAAFQTEILPLQGQDKNLSLSVFTVAGVVDAIIFDGTSDSE